MQKTINLCSGCQLPHGTAKNKNNHQHSCHPGEKIYSNKKPVQETRK